MWSKQLPQASAGQLKLLSKQLPQQSAVQLIVVSLVVVVCMRDVVDADTNQAVHVIGLKKQ